MFWSKLFLFVLPVVVIGELKGGFNYNRCNATFGPSNWPGACKAQTSGTPINLCSSVPFPGCPPQLRVANYECLRDLKIYNDGASVGLELVDNPPQLLVDSLSFLVNRSRTPGFQLWTLHNIHVHWGRKGKPDEGSEHFLEGRQFAAEVHFVHYNSRFSNFSTAVASQQPDALLVVGVFLELNRFVLAPLLRREDLEAPFITVLTDAIATATKTSKPLPKRVRLSDLFDPRDDFYSYGGSLTTPGCFEIVTWIVMRTPQKISQASLEKLWGASSTPLPASEKFSTQSEGQLISLYGNYRPLQPLAGRNLFFTGVCPARSCQGVTEPDFQCQI